jgi:hypothetical protein
MVSRINEKNVFGALIGDAETNVTGVTFYGPEEEPDTSAALKWCVLDIDYREDESRLTDWAASGRLTATINAKTSIGNAYSARDVANSLTANFTKTAVAIVVSSVTVGKVVFGAQPTSKSLGEADGTQAHYWEIDFQVFSTS